MPANWSEEVHRIMQEQNVGQVAYVPDTGLKHVIELVVADKKMRAVPLTTEEEGVALATGAWLAGQRSVLLLQSSGVGNCINMLGMAIECRIPFLMLVTMRGQWGEFNPWQMPMAQATASVLTAMGVIVQPVERADDVAETFAAAGRLAFNTNRVVAVQVAQRVVGAKEFK